MHQRNETQVAEFFFTPIGDGDLSGALQGHFAVVGAEGMGGQVFDQTTAFNAANGGAPAVAFKGGCQASTQRKGRVDPQVTRVVGAIDVFHEVEAFGGDAIFGVVGQAAQEARQGHAHITCVFRLAEGLPLGVLHRVEDLGQIARLAQVGEAL